MDDATEIEDGLLEYFGNAKFEKLEQLHVVMYWAVSNDALELARRCIDHNQEVLRWSREGNTWLHVAAANGTMEVLDLLLDNVEEKPEQAAEWVSAEGIIKQNNQGDSPLTICIDRGHDEVQELFWIELQQLRDTDTALIKKYSAAADWILELLARYEKPGHENILAEFLQEWYDKDPKDPIPNTALHWAVQRGKVVVVWWLLSKGGYSSSGAIESAQKLVQDSDGDDDICGHIRELLLHPPPILNHIPNPNKEHIPTFQINVDVVNDSASISPALNSPGNIVDILSNRKSISIRYAQPSIHEIIYGAGPELVMKNAKDDLRQRDLNLLRDALGRTVPEQGENGHESSVGESGTPDWVKSISSQQDKYDPEEWSKVFRWIHLPVNEVRVSRFISYH
ncbi:ankyrin repeat-containing domain protein [Nemania serpens]|nr:ankyrin repeat-containing domain protein [Nemania serpens]